MADASRIVLDGFILKRESRTRSTTRTTTAIHAASAWKEVSDLYGRRR